MPYSVVSIGKEFSPKSIQALAQTLSGYESQGWEFVFAFPVTRRTCLFFTDETYLAVFRQRRIESPSQPGPAE